MNLHDIQERIAGIPCMTYAQAKVVTDLVIENRFQNILELGFHHGVSTCYLAGALDELGAGSLTTIDLCAARDTDPNVEQLLDKLGLDQYVTVFYEPTSYTWRLMRMIEEDPSPRFDFCYVDGAHDWFTDGLLFSGWPSSGGLGLVTASVCFLPN